MINIKELEDILSNALDIAPSDFARPIGFGTYNESSIDIDTHCYLAGVDMSETFISGWVSEIKFRIYSFLIENSRWESEKLWVTKLSQTGHIPSKDYPLGIEIGEDRFACSLIRGSEKITKSVLVVYSQLNFLKKKSKNFSNSAILVLRIQEWGKGKLTEEELEAATYLAKDMFK